MFSFFSGVTISFGLIVAIGAQNAWVLSMSIRGQYPWTIAAVCMFIDSVLMAIGISSIAKLQELIPPLVPFMTLAGIALLSFMILQSLQRVYNGNQGLDSAAGVQSTTRWAVIIQAMSISLLNPHVYLDTVILIGSIGSVHESPWFFWLGGVTSSVIWFSLLSGLGKPLQSWLKSPKRWRLFDGIISVLLTWVVIGLGKTLI